MHAAHAFDATPLRTIFQPLIDADTGMAFAYQARVSAPDTGSPLERERARYEAAMDAAVTQGILAGDAMLALPLLPCGEPDRQVAALFRAALAHRVPTSRLLLEIGIGSRDDLEAAAELIETCVLRGMEVALDGFAAGPSAMRLIARFAPRYVKLDPALTRNIDGSALRQVIAQGVVRHARNTGYTMIAQDVSTPGELSVLYALGISHLQSHWLARAPMPTAVPLGTPRVVSHTRLGHRQEALAMAG
jgi:EAL domain-containing protein (putative c-di-GMP-specific phosphodiesterase class I)